VHAKYATVVKLAEVQIECLSTRLLELQLRYRFPLR
jgi:hypothetical protein